MREVARNGQVLRATTLLTWLLYAKWAIFTRARPESHVTRLFPAPQHLHARNGAKHSRWVYKKGGPVRLKESRQSRDSRG